MEMKEIIGTGAFGSVYRGVKDNGNYAVKKVSKALLLTDQKKMYFNNEIYLLKQIKHKNIARYIDKNETFSCYYIILEYCNGGTLLNALNDYKTKHNNLLPEKTVGYLTKQIIEGLVYLHNMNIIHRDIKAENILLHFDNEKDKDTMELSKATVKIIDFGFARYLHKNELASSIIGTPLCMDPCILSAINNEKIVYSEKCDIWSLGIVVYQLSIGVTPFQGNNVNELYDNVTKFNCSISHDIKLSNECVSFINKLLTIEENKRPNAIDLLEEPFIIKDYKDYNKVLSLKSNQEKTIKHCFTEYWEDKLPISAQTTREKSPDRPFGKDSDQAEIDSVLRHTVKKPLIRKEITKIKINRRKQTIVSNDNKKERGHYRRSSTPSQLEDNTSSFGINSFLLAKSSLKK